MNDPAYTAFAVPIMVFLYFNMERMTALWQCTSQQQIPWQMQTGAPFCKKIDSLFRPFVNPVRNDAGIGAWNHCYTNCGTVKSQRQFFAGCCISQYRDMNKTLTGPAASAGDQLAISSHPEVNFALTTSRYTPPLKLWASSGEGKGVFLADCPFFKQSPNKLLIFPK